MKCYNFSIKSQEKFMFKSDFLWGVAAAAHQIEGATNIDSRGPSV